jgi:3'-phosphoadenosine 5'-phosphosulfate sulfotransferase (PAPS reductase)/FAD synthetase
MAKVGDGPKIAHWQLKQRQSQPLNVKIQMSLRRIKEWHEHWGGEVYVAFSGGLDSTLLLYLVRSMYPDCPAFCVNHRMLYPEIRAFVEQADSITVIRPDKTFSCVVKEYGYPVISKRVAMGVSRYRRTNSDVQRKLRLHGGINPTSGKRQHRSVPIKWHFLVDAPFCISEACCYWMKKKPFRQIGGKPYLGTRASEGFVRQMDYMRFGCNAFQKASPQSTPLAFWTHDDVWEYIRSNNIPYSPIYDMGYQSTGCFPCMFGVHMEDYPNRFQRMYTTHPKLWNYCMDKLGIQQVLEYINVPYKPAIGKEIQ